MKTEVFRGGFHSSTREEIAETKSSIVTLFVSESSKISSLLGSDEVLLYRASKKKKYCSTETVH